MCTSWELLSGDHMGRVIFELDEEDFESLFETQRSMLEVMLRIEKLLKEKYDAGSKSKTSRNKAS